MFSLDMESGVFQVGVAGGAFGQEIDAHAFEHLQLRVRSTLRWRAGAMCGDQQQALITAQIVDRTDAQFIGGDGRALPQMATDLVGELHPVDQLVVHHVLSQLLHGQFLQGRRALFHRRSYRGPGR